METDIYQKNEKYFMVGMLVLVLTLGLLLFSLYITPYLIWTLAYEVPDFIIYAIHYLHDTYDYTNGTSRFLVGAFFFTLSIITGIVAYLISRKLDTQLYGAELEESSQALKTNEHAVEERRQDIKESVGLGLKIFILMVLIVAAVLFFHSLL